MIFTVAAIASALLLGQSGTDPFEAVPRCEVLRNCERPGQPPILEKPVGGLMLTPPDQGPLPPSPGIMRAVPRPIGNPAMWLTADDYPADAQAAGAAGLVTVELMIGEDGWAITCGFRLPTDNESLNLATCLTLLRRARYSPATDLAGNPLLVPAVRRVRWQLPEEEFGDVPVLPPVPTLNRANIVGLNSELSKAQDLPLLPPPPPPEMFQAEVIPPRILSEVRSLARWEELRTNPFGPPQIMPDYPADSVTWLMRIDVAPTGRVVGCTVVEGSPFPLLNQLVCERYRGQARFDAAQDGSGIHIASAIYAQWTLRRLVVPPSPAQ